jgi:hypothetical protein
MYDPTNLLDLQLIPRSIQEATAETRFEFNISSWPGAFQQLTPMVISAFLAAAQKRGALWIAGKGGLCVTEHGALQASTSQVKDRNVLCILAMMYI